MGMVVAHELLGDHPHLTTFILFYYFLVELFFSELGWVGLCACQWDAQQLR
jgi:hypothetical protein